MFDIRTDLAEELRSHAMAQKAKEDKGELDGVLFSEKTDGDVRISEIRVTSEAGEKKLGKPRGNYVTLSFPTASGLDYTGFIHLCDLLAGEIKRLGGKAESVLICGLGNRALAADAVGVTAADYVLATHHIRRCDADMFKKSGFFDVSVLTPGVMSKTGMEAAALLQSAAAEVKPDLVVAIDSLAARETNRLARTVQVCDTGIAPGSGIGNRRAALDRALLGVPVLAIGVPTVVDTATLLRDALDGYAPKEDVLREVAGLFVSPKEIDGIVRNVGRMIGYALNRAFHGAFPYEEIAMMT